jgi:hypothetical protein
MRGNHLLDTFTFLELKNSRSKTEILNLMRGGSRQPQELEERNNSLATFSYIPRLTYVGFTLTWA